MWKLSAPTGGELHRLCLCGFGGTREAAGLAPLLFNLRERLQAGRKQTELRWGVSEFMEMVPWLLGQCQPWFLTEGQCAVPTWPLPRVFSHSGTAETILTLSTQECPGPHSAKTVNSSPSYIQCNTKERKKIWQTSTLAQQVLLTSLLTFQTSAGPEWFRTPLYSVFTGLTLHIFSLQLPVFCPTPTSLV